MSATIPDSQGRAEVAEAALTSALAGRPLVSVERFTTAYRSCYAAPYPLEAIRPALAVGCYRPWQPAGPRRVIAAEETIRIRSPRGRHSWLTGVLASAQQALTGLEGPTVVTGWYATSELRALAGPGGTVAAIDGTLRDRIEDKADFDHLLRAAGVADEVRIPAIRVDGSLSSLGELRRAVGASRVVVQAGVTSGGRGTFFADDVAGLALAAWMPGPYRVSAFIKGWSSNVTVLSVPDGTGGACVYVDRPSHKAIAVEELGIGSAKSAGNDWSYPWPPGAAAALVEAAVRIGEWAWSEHRMTGLFGLDAILTPGGEVKVNEINCRNQGTTEVSSVNQQLRGQPPFVIAHLVTMLGGRVDWLGDPSEYNHETIRRATQPGTGPFYAKVRLGGQGPVQISPDFPGPGVYRLDEAGRLHLVRGGAHPADADADRGEVLIASAPGPDVACHPGAEIATLEGVTSGPGRPFAGPSTASGQALRFASALLDLFVPVPEGQETRP
jgi:hypothetical protein